MKVKSSPRYNGNISCICVVIRIYDGSSKNCCVVSERGSYFVVIDLHIQSVCIYLKKYEEIMTVNVVVKIIIVCIHVDYDRDNDFILFVPCPQLVIL